MSGNRRRLQLDTDDGGEPGSSFGIKALSPSPSPSPIEVGIEFVLEVRMATWVDGAYMPEITGPLGAVMAQYQDDPFAASEALQIAMQNQLSNATALQVGALSMGAVLNGAV